MATPQRISIKLTPEQQEALRQATGKNAVAIEMTVEELEERVAPNWGGFRGWVQPLA